MRFVRDLKAADVARELGLSARQLTRRTEAALGKLRHELERSAVKRSSRPRWRHGCRRGGRELGATWPPRKASTSATWPGPTTWPWLQEAGPEDGWTARVEELPGCVATGKTRVDAVARVDEGDARVDRGRARARPGSASSATRPTRTAGELLVRMPRSPARRPFKGCRARGGEPQPVPSPSVLASAVSWRKQEERQAGALECLRERAAPCAQPQRRGALDRGAYRARVAGGGAGPAALGAAARGSSVPRAARGRRPRAPAPPTRREAGACRAGPMMSSIMKRSAVLEG